MGIPYLYVRRDVVGVEHLLLGLHLRPIMNAHTRGASAPAPRVTLAPNVRKIIAAIGFLIKEAERHNRAVTQYDLVKSLFIADKAHLNKFGRPITFDNYVAMKHGPVPSLAYDLLKQNQLIMRKNHIDSVPWSVTSAEELGSGCFVFTNAVASDQRDVLSDSDIEALQGGFSVVSGLSFGQIRKLTHGDPAYKEAWRDGESQNTLMSLGLLFDTPDYDAAEDIKDVSHQTSENASLEDDDFESYFAKLERW